MKRLYLGEFEEIVLLTVGVLYTKAYAVAIKEEIAEQTGRNVNISAVHTALYRLEEKGFLESKLGDAEARRGGKRKRLFTITTLGRKVLVETMELRQKIWAQIPKPALGFSY
ncbi:PadR family transcriptional regulator [Bacteroidota bacterium]